MICDARTLEVLYMLAMYIKITFLSFRLDFLGPCNKQLVGAIRGENQHRILAVGAVCGVASARRSGGVGR